jgi:hypothetical protein
LQEAVALIAVVADRSMVGLLSNVARGCCCTVPVADRSMALCAYKSLIWAPILLHLAGLILNTIATLVALIWIP